MPIHLPKSTIVFLVGTNCAGKSEINKAFLSMPGWQVVDIDFLYVEVAHSIWKKFFPQEYALLNKVILYEKLLYAIKYNKVFFKSNTTVQHAAKVRNAIILLQQNPFWTSRDTYIKISFYQEMLLCFYNKIQAYVIQGFNVIATNTSFIELSQLHFPNAHIIKVLTYCPFDVMITRVRARNNQLNPQNIFFAQALFNFNALFSLSKNNYHQLDILIKSKFLKAADIIESSLNDLSSTPDFTIDSYFEYKKNFLSYFNQDKVYIYPKAQYDLILRTDQNNPQQCKEILLSSLKKI